MREVSIRTMELAESALEEAAERKLRRQPITSRRDRAAGSCVSAADRRPSEVRTISVEDYLNGQV